MSDNESPTTVAMHATVNGQSPGVDGIESHGTGRRAVSHVSTRAETMVRLAAQEVVDLLREIDRDARRAGRSVPTPQEKEALTASFWWAIREFTATEARVSEAQHFSCALAARELLHPWLLRSSYWARSFIKPHGYAGDFRMLEWMYDLETDECADPTNPAVVNLLDYLYGTVHSVRAVWHRRRWYAQLIGKARPLGETGEPVRILDLACGGSRYVRDVIDAETGVNATQLTFLDQDPTALSFVATWLPDSLCGDGRLICGPVRHVRRLLDENGGNEDFDLVISTGLFDYLGDDDARQLLADMCDLTRPEGLIAICNFSPHDASRLVKEWLVDWALIYRDASALRALVPDAHAVSFDSSPDGGLVYALISTPPAGSTSSSGCEARRVSG